MTVIANPIYDAVFKFMMEDKKVAKILLSALLNKENIVETKNEQGQKRNYGLPIISIYILGHPLGDLTEPVVYVRRSYMEQYIDS